MKKIFDGKFYNPSRGNLSFEKVIKEMTNWMKERPGGFYDIIVGCDSSSGQEPHFPVAMVILRKGEGGRFFLKKVKYRNKKFFNWHQRVLEEVLLSCDLALALRERLEGEIEKVSQSLDRGKKLDYQFRYIHADIGAEGATKDMIKEVTGLIRGNGFEPKIKPEAYVASIVADRFA